MQDFSCPGATFAFCSHEEKLPRQGGLPGVVQRVIRLSKLPRGNEKLMWTVTGVRPCTEAKLTPASVSCPGAVSCPGIMWTGPKAQGSHQPPSLPSFIYIRELIFNDSNFQHCSLQALFTRIRIIIVPFYPEKVSSDRNSIHKYLDRLPILFTRSQTRFLSRQTLCG